MATPRAAWQVLPGALANAQGPQSFDRPSREESIDSSRYELLLKIGAGGMASVYVGRAFGSAGFSRLVAVKRAHPHLVHDPGSQKMLLREAQLASKLTHANVAAVLDVERTDDEILLIMDYVEGASFDDIITAGMRVGWPIPAPVALRIVLDACAGLIAAHELGDDEGRPLGFLHRDVSPHNILVGVDGTARISDFGVAKGLGARRSASSIGSLAGKLAYTAPEVIRHVCFSVKSDLFAMGVLTWEALARKRLFRSDAEGETARRVLTLVPPKISEVAPELGTRFDAIVQQALEKDPSRRYGTVREFMAALEGAARQGGGIATSSEVSAYVRGVVGEELMRRRDRLRAIDTEPPRSGVVPRAHPRAAGQDRAQGSFSQSAPPALAGSSLESAAPRSTSVPLIPSEMMPALPFMPGEADASWASPSTIRGATPAPRVSKGAVLLAVGLGSLLAIGTFLARSESSSRGRSAPPPAGAVVAPAQGRPAQPR